MPWKVWKPMDERLKFIARLLDGEKMAGLCREYGPSNKIARKGLAMLWQPSIAVGAQTAELPQRSPHGACR